MEVEPRKNWTPKILYWPLLGKLPSATIRKFDIFRWGHYLKNFEFYVLKGPPILWKRGDTIQGRTLYKGGHYLRKYGIWIKIIQTKIENNEASCGKAKLRNKWSYVANTMLIKKVSKNIITTVTVMITSVYFHLDDSYLLKFYIYGVPSTPF